MAADFFMSIVIKSYFCLCKKKSNFIFLNLFWIVYDQNANKMKKPVLEDIGLLIARLGAGGMILTHGYPKLMRFFGDEPIKFMDFLGLGPVVSLSLAVFAEVVCAILIMIGFKTRLATIPLMITMLTAALVAHAADPFGRKELPLLYFIVFFVIMIFGAGKFALDSFGKKRLL